MKSAIQRGTAARAGHDPRALALRVIDRVLAGRENSQAALDAALRGARLVPTDTGLCTQLVYGYLRQGMRLDWVLARSMSNPEKLPVEMRLTLGLAAYEMAFLRIPGYASVDWAVSRIRHRFSRTLAGVANAVLRRFSLNGNNFHDPAFYEASIENPQERRAIWHSLPLWLVRLWEGAYGEEQAALYMAASGSEAVPAVRVNGSRDGAAQLRNELIGEHGGIAVGAWGAAFPQGLPYIARNLEKTGRISFQSAAAQEALQAMLPHAWQSPVWDACSGRGGKTAALLELGLDVRLASDVAASRRNSLPQEMARLGLPLPELAGGVEQVPAGARFATILVDAPCSGLGTLCRRPEIRFRRQLADIAGMAAIQDAILDSATAHLLPGGLLAYVTCTLSPEENQKRSDAFLSRHQGFVCEREWSTAADSPWREFFYAAALRKNK